jgi:DNA mismatch endonuclease, patch repair protein
MGTDAPNVQRRPSRPRRLRGSAPISRSENMSRIRAKNTRPELAVRKVFWAAGLRYRLHDKRLPGKPDLILAGRRTVVFVHGCFWHCHEGCSNFRIPKTRSDWWAAKLSRNRTRDAQVREQLVAKGWRVVVIWECETGSALAIESYVAAIRNGSDAVMRLSETARTKRKRALC